MNNTVAIDLSKLHGFRLLALSTPQPGQPLTNASLPEMLGARLGQKVGLVKHSGV